MNWELLSLLAGEGLSSVSSEAACSASLSQVLLPKVLCFSFFVGGTDVICAPQGLQQFVSCFLESQLLNSTDPLSSFYEVGTVHSLQ